MDTSIVVLIILSDLHSIYYELILILYIDGHFCSPNAFFPGSVLVPLTMSLASLAGSRSIAKSAAKLVGQDVIHDELVPAYRHHPAAPVGQLFFWP